MNHLWRCLRPLVWLLLAAAARGESPPSTGDAVAEFAPLDGAILEFMELIDCRAATVAVSREGELLHARGFGWRDRRRTEPTRPETPMRIASVAKPLTAAAVKELIRAGRLQADTPVLEWLALEPPAGADQRWARVTVSHLLEHRGGWDRETGFDPMFHSVRIERALELDRPAEPEDVIRYMLGRPLDFDPGVRAAYSNFGYCLLGRVIERASGRPYLETLHEQLCRPLGIDDLRLARSLPRDRPPQEVEYPADGLRMEVMDSHGGLIASAPSLCRFLDRYWINGEPRRAGERGDRTFFGSLPGTTAMVRQRPDGTNVAALFNARRDRTIHEDLRLLKQAVDAALAGGETR